MKFNMKMRNSSIKENFLTSLLFGAGGCIVQIIVVLLVVAFIGGVYFYLIPLGVIWSLNTLGLATIAHTFSTYAAVGVIVLVLTGVFGS